jgi:xylulokinase
MLSAGGSLKWLRDALFPGVAYETLDSEASAVGPGAAGLVFLPYLTGERCPYPDPLARGAFVGLTARHTRGHLVRAVLEGVAFGMGQILDLVRGLGVPAATVRMSGGGAASDLWRRIHADVLRTPIEITNSTEGPALGAAILAGVGVNTWPSVAEACYQLITPVSVTYPEPSLSDPYMAPRAAYESLYDRLSPTFKSLAAIDGLS